MFYKIGVLKNFVKHTGKTPVPESLFNKVTDLYLTTFLKEKTPIQLFSDEFCERYKTSFLQNTSSQLLLFYRQKNLPIN